MKLLGFYNKVWHVGRLPTSWKEAVIIPIRKPGKNPSSPCNYRPIALTSHRGNIVEREWVWEVERNYGSCYMPRN